jgi:hypothetical protein
LRASWGLREVSFFCNPERQRGIHIGLSDSSAHKSRYELRRTFKFIVTRWIPRCARDFRKRHFTKSPRYSYRSATMGSTLVAWRAGMKLAASVTVASTAVTPAKMAGSQAVTPNNMLRIR